ncbi:MAG: energy-coupling factor ABC transporter permease [Burkholderiaceae bacterium]
MFNYPVPMSLAVPSALLSLLFVAEAWRRAGWLQASWADHLRWATATAVVFAAHQMAIRLPPDIELHYLGGAALALMLGYPRALVSMSLVLAADALIVGQAESLGIRLLLAGVLPVMLMAVLSNLARRHLPRNPFVFLLGCGFFGLFFCYALQVAITLLVSQALGPPRVGGIGDILAFGLLLASGEAVLEGMILTVLVAYLPDSVRMFDDAHYLPGPWSR